MSNYVQPIYQGNGFTCPHCNVYSAMSWSDLFTQFNSLRDSGFSLASCHHCQNASIWLDKIDSMIFPLTQNAPLPNSDLPDTCIKIYMEAREIANVSPRGAAALLRLCMQQLLIELGEKGKNINDDIGNLVKKGLPVRIQQALDSVRVIGNNAVHPGEITLDDSPEYANVLFSLVNMIVDDQITQPKEVEKLFGTLPQGAKEHIEKRDENA